MKDNAVNSNKHRTVHVAGMGGICSLVDIKKQLIRLSNGIWWVSWRRPTVLWQFSINLGDLSTQAENYFSVSIQFCRCAKILSIKPNTSWTYVSHYKSSRRSKGHTHYLF